MRHRATTPHPFISDVGLARSIIYPVFLKPPRYSVELTILMPCLNESRTLQACIGKARAFLDRHGITGEILIADNGSIDGSQQLARSLNARVIDVPTRGYGAALRAGTEAALGRYVIMGDSDDSYDFSALEPFVDALRDGADLVMGNRFAGGIRPGAMPALHRYLGNPVLSAIGRLFFGTPIRDFHCGLRGYRKESMLELGLCSDGMEYASEMVVKATFAKLDIREVPTTLSPDGRGRPPHLRSWRDGWRHLRFLLVHAPHWLYLYPGAMLLTAGGVGLLALAIGPVAIGDSGLDIHTMMYATLSFVMGIQMVLFSSAARYHATRIGVLPAARRSGALFQSLSLERSLLCALGLLIAGVMLSALGLYIWWKEDFGTLQPREVMRIVIPATTFIAMSIQVFTSAFLMEYLRLSPRNAASRQRDLTSESGASQ
jgi:glycosyltransferase involved in cell wall biosynthesis